MHRTRWLCLASILVFLAGCQPRPVDQPVQAAPTAQLQASATLEPVKSPQPGYTAAAITTTPADLPAAPALTALDPCAAAGVQPQDTISLERLATCGSVVVEELSGKIRFSQLNPAVGQGYPSWAEPASGGGVLITSSGGSVIRVSSTGRVEWQDEIGSELEPDYGGERGYACRDSREMADGGFSVLCYAIHYRPSSSSQPYLVRYDRAGQRASAEKIAQKPGMALTLDAQGAPAWFHTFGLGSGWVIETADGGYVLAWVSSINGPDDQTRLARADAQRQYAWDRLVCARTGAMPQPDQIPCHLNQLGEIIQTRDGGFALTGADSTDHGAYLLKLDAQGITEWLLYSGGITDRGWAVRQQPEGGYLVAGGRGGNALLFRASQDGRLLWAKEFNSPEYENFEKLVALADGSFFAIGTKQAFGGDVVNMWLLKVEE